jgi:hypothetical protein
MKFVFFCSAFVIGLYTEVPKESHMSHEVAIFYNINWLTLIIILRFVSFFSSEKCNAVAVDLAFR